MAPTAEHVRNPHSIKITLAADQAPGAVVPWGDRIGVLPVGGVSGDEAALEVEGIYEVPKATGGGTGFSIGDSAGWHVANDNAVAASGAGATKWAGIVTKDAADADEYVQVSIGLAPAGTVTA